MQPVKPLIIIGSAPCALTDLAAIWGHDPNSHRGHLSNKGVPSCLIPADACDYAAAGLDAIGKVAAPLIFVATYHPEDIPAIRERYAAANGAAPCRAVGMKAEEGIDIIEPYTPPSGSSCLMAVMAGIRMGYKKIILAGCPLEGVNEKGGSYTVYQKGWQAHLDEYVGKVRSLSGWTKDFLGAPTEAWLHD